MFKVYFSLVALLFWMAVDAHYLGSRQEDIKRQFCVELYSEEGTLSKQDANELCFARLAWVIKEQRGNFKLFSSTFLKRRFYFWDEY